MHRTPEAGGHRGDQSAVFAVPGIRCPTGAARQEVPDRREPERRHLQGDFPTNPQIENEKDEKSILQMPRFFLRGIYQPLQSSQRFLVPAEDTLNMTPI